MTGIDLVEMPDAEVCCGFGGTFCVKYPGISGRMVSEKVENIAAAGVDTVLAGDIGCLLNIAGRMRRENRIGRVFHVAEVLAGMADRGIGEPAAVGDGCPERAAPADRVAGSEPAEMIPESHRFPDLAERALADEGLRVALDRARQGFIGNRRKAVDALPEFQALRDAARRIKEHSLSNLDLYLEKFESQVTASGGQVHWAADAAEARAAILDICRRAGAQTATKGKSMVGEEVALNEALEEADIEVVETDLGEYIIQLADETPSHIVAPAIHKTREQIRDLFTSTTPRSASRRPASGMPSWWRGRGTCCGASFCAPMSGSRGRTSSSRNQARRSS